MTKISSKSWQKEYKYFLISIKVIKALQKSVAEKFKIFESVRSRISRSLFALPLSYVSKHASIDEGTIVMHRVAVNAAAKVGKNCILNTGAVIEHDVVIKDTCHIATCAVVNGGTVVGENCFIGQQFSSQGRDSGGKRFCNRRKGDNPGAVLPEKSFVKGL